ncbi:MAG: Mth938-like domain-containing protein [Candidatus Bathyarchaeia archaeon]
MIESYGFGRIVVDGKEYTTDLIIFPDRVEDGWWRKQGHRLYVEDIEEVVEERPEVFVVGTGYWGLMTVPAETKRHIEEKGIELVIQPTKQACETYNKLIQSGKQAVAAFHLTC